jgi:ribose/xylose/arabinose/galactoside ABC-type transport system permease subunit
MIRLFSPRLSEVFSPYWLVVLLSIATAAAMIAVPDFATSENLGNVVAQGAPLAVVATGQTFVILCGLIDLTIGQLLGLNVVLSCELAAGRSEWFLPALALSLGLGAGAGGLTGMLNNWLRIPSLILTFGLLSVLQGLIFLLTDRSVGQAPPQFVWLANARYAGIPVAAGVVLATTFCAHLVLKRTGIGRHLYAVGGNAENARRGGVDPGSVTLFAFLASGLSAGLGAVLVAGRLGTGFPHAGTGYELDAIVAVVLGGTSLAGGTGNVIGTLAGAMALALISNVLNLLQISAFLQIFLKGLIVIAAILLNQPPAARA